MVAPAHNALLATTAPATTSHTRAAQGHTRDAPPPALDALVVYLAALGNTVLQAQVPVTTAPAATPVSLTLSPTQPRATHAQLESPRRALQYAMALQKEHFVIFALQDAMQRVRARLPARPVRQENTILGLAQAIQHLVFSVLKAPLALQAHHLATSAQQDAIQQQARHLVDSVMLVSIPRRSLQNVRVVILDTTQKNHRQVARCARLEPSVTQQHLLDVSSVHQDTTPLRAQRVVLPAPDYLPRTVCASRRRQLSAF